jgi:hypothetical protein
MVTKRKLHRVREAARKDQAEAVTPEWRADQHPRWRRHDKKMEQALRGVDPARFEALAERGRH